MPRTATSDITSIAVGAALRQARLEIGITQQELASRLNVSAPYLSSIENGRMNVTIGQLSAIANALGAILDITFRVPGTHDRARHTGTARAREAGGLNTAVAGASSSRPPRPCGPLTTTSTLGAGARERRRLDRLATALPRRVRTLLQVGLMRDQRMSTLCDIRSHKGDAP